VLAGVGALLVGLRCSVGVGTVAGVLELVPIVGPVLGALLGLLRALVLQPFPDRTLGGSVLRGDPAGREQRARSAPHRHAVGLHPSGAMLALPAGREVAGLLGGLFVVPVVGVAWVLIGAPYRRLAHGVEDPAPVRRGWRSGARRATSFHRRGVPHGRGAPARRQAS
jgi:hypothetical protein